MGEEGVLGAARWARGSVRCNSGNVTDEIVARYIDNQHVSGGQDQDKEFKVDG